MSHPTGICYKHSLNASERADPNFRIRRHPSRDYVFIAADIPDAATMLDGLDIPDQPTQYAVVRGREFGWMCPDPTAQRLIVYITREEIAKGEEVETFSTDSKEAAERYLVTGEPWFPSREDFFSALEAMMRAGQT